MNLEHEEYEGELETLRKKSEVLDKIFEMILEEGMGITFVDIDYDDYKVENFDGC